MAWFAGATLALASNGYGKLIRVDGDAQPGGDGVSWVTAHKFLQHALAADLDADGNVTEPIPFDAIGRRRVLGAAVDLGPYEFEPEPVADPPVSSIVVTKILPLDTITIPP